MLMLSQRLLSLPIVSIQTGGRLATIASAIIDPRQLRVVAFYCEGPMVGVHPAILHSEDVREVSSMGLIIDSADEIMSTDDLVRLKEILDFNFKLEDKQVVEENGRKVGKVIAYSLEANSFYIMKLHVRPGLLSAFGTTERIIDRSQIVEISPQKIIVKSATVKEEKAEKAKATPAIENPFRQASPQPDMSTTQQD